MQVIAPDFFAPFSGPSSAKTEERPGDGLFDSLLREEEARYKEDPQQLRDRPETAPPAREESPRDERLPEERRDDEPPRETRVQRDDSPAEDHAPRREPEAAADDHRPSGRETDHAAPADDGDAGTGSGEDAVKKNPVAQAAQSQPFTGLPLAEARPRGVAPASQVSTQSTTLPSGVAVDETAAVTPATTANHAAAAQTGAKAATAGQASGEATSAPAKTTALPASAAAPAEKATQRAAATATAKPANPVAAEHRQSPTQAASAPGVERANPAAVARGAGNEATIVVETADSLSSRPAAALGGGAATAALAQNARQAGNGRATAPSTAGDTVQPDAAQKPAAQAGQQAKVPEVALSAAADKAIQVSPALASGSGGETSGNSGGQGNSLVTPLGASGTASTAASQSTSFAEAMANARNTPAADPAEQIAVQVRRAQVAGQEQINIKLHPAELGRIEVRLESNSDGTLRAVISAERSETLDLLQRDARGLERALQEAGVKTDSGSLNFNLRGQGQPQDQQAEGNGGSLPGASDGDAGEAESHELPGNEAQAYEASHDGALDIRV